MRLRDSVSNAKISPRIVCEDGIEVAQEYEDTEKKIVRRPRSRGNGTVAKEMNMSLMVLSPTDVLVLVL